MPSLFGNKAHAPIRRHKEVERATSTQRQSLLASTGRFGVTNPVRWNFSEKKVGKSPTP